MKLLFLLLLCVLILARSARSPSFDVRLHGSLSIPIASFVERGLFIKTFCHQKYLNRRIVYSSGHQGTFNPAVITNKEVHMVHGNINTNDETSHTTSNASVNSTCAQPPPPPRATAGHLPALSVPGMGHLQILHCPGAGHLPTPGPFPSF